MSLSLSEINELAVGACFEKEIKALNNKVVKLKQISIGDLEKWREGCMTKGADGNEVFKVHGSRAKLVSLCLTDDEGGKTPADQISKWKFEVVEELFHACQEINGVVKTETVSEEKKD